MGLYMLQSFILVVAEKVVMMMMLIDDCDIDYLSDGFFLRLTKESVAKQSPTVLVSLRRNAGLCSRAIHPQR